MIYIGQKKTEELFAGLRSANIRVDSLRVNADGGFDAEIFRNTCFRHKDTASIDFNSANEEMHNNYLLDELLIYKERYGIERTNAWMDSCRTLLNRVDTPEKNTEKKKV